MNPHEDQGQTVQSNADAVQDDSQSAESQGLIAQFLEGLEDGPIKDEVASRLEKMRKHTDGQTTKQFDKLNQELKAYRRAGDPETARLASNLYAALQQDPIETLRYLLDQGLEDGQTVAKELATQYKDLIDEVKDASDAQGAGLTQADVEKLVAEATAAQYAEMQQARELEQTARIAEGWLNDEASKLGLELDSEER